MAGSYRALLIGNSTYPADEHNLQPLKGPVKDISALNRALVDRDTGLFADADITLLAETSSNRALRAISRFFGAAERDDVLLLYFSGHGKLDQSGRLHLCMQDTETTDLLSSAVSSTRINEFAEASRARNVVIVLDCCHAGAFRGGDFGDAVAGPGRYVLTSCRSTQLANDATIENGTSYFTQHLVEGLTTAAADHDGDGFVSFSDVYAYIDGQLRAEGKQIPQRRVSGDGDLRLAKRPSPPAGLDLGRSSAESPAHPPAAPPAAPPSPPAGPPPRRPVAPDEGPAPRRRLSRRWLIGAVVAAVVIAAAIIIPIVASGGSDHPGPYTGITTATTGSYTATGPWRLELADNPTGGGDDNGCRVTVPEIRALPLLDRVYTSATAQVNRTGTVHWQTNDARCVVSARPGPGQLALPAVVGPSVGDTQAFVPPPRLSVVVRDFSGDTHCTLSLVEVATGNVIDFKDTTPGAAAATFDVPTGVKLAYVHQDDCGVQISAAS